MTKPAFTPGPWFAHGKLGKSLQYGVSAGKPYNPSIGAVRRIAKCGSPYPGRTPELDAEDEANARLIAAAPTMFSFIEKMAAEGDSEAISFMEQFNARS